MEQELLQHNPQEPRQISGWLTFFLWVGVGLGAIVSCIRTLVEVSEFGFTLFSTIVYAGYLGSLLTVAILTIIAFYKRKPNAVALANVYILMHFVDAILTLVVAVMIDDESFIKDFARSIIWAITWFTYLQCSKQVKEVIPQENRTWKPTEIVLLMVFVVSMISYVVGLNMLQSNPFNTSLVSKDYLIKSTIEAMNEDLPKDMNGLLFYSVTNENHIITYNYKFPYNEISDIDMDFIKEYSVVYRQQLLQEFAQETDDELVNFYHLIFDNGYDLCHSFQDKNQTSLYNCIFTAEEYYKAETAGENFRCDPKVFETLVEKKNNKLPVDYMGDATLRNIMLDINNNQVFYYVILPEMGGLEYLITDDYLNTYIKENWNSISDNIIALATIDKLDLYFIFNTNKGIRHASIHLPYSEYSTFED